MHRRTILAVAIIAALASAAFAQPASSTVQTPDTTNGLTMRLSAERVQQLMSEAQADAATPEELRQKQAELYGQALEMLKQADQWTTRGAESESAREQAPSLVQKLRDELAASVEEAVSQPTTTATLQELEQGLSAAQVELNTAQKDATDLSAELKRRADRRVEIPGLISAARQRLQEIKVEEAAGPLPDEAPEVTRARRILLEARRQALEEEIAAHEKEVQSYAARGDLLALRQDVSSRKIARLEKQVTAYQEIINSRRRGEAEKAARIASQKRREAADAHPVIQKLTAENLAYAQERVGPEGLSSKIEAASTQLQQATSALERLRAQAKSLQSKVSAVGLSNAIGMLLRKQREEVREVLRNTEDTPRNEEIGRMHFSILELEDEQERLRDLDAEAHQLGTQVAVTSQSMPAQQARQIVRNLLEERRNYVQALIKDSNAYFQTLIELDTAEKQLRSEATSYANYIDERVLWIPSGRLRFWKDREKTADTLQWMFAPHNWIKMPAALVSDMQDVPLFYGLALVIPVLLLWGRRHLWAALHDSAPASRTSHISPLMVVRGLMATVLLALPAPFMIGFIGWRLGDGIGLGDFIRAVGDALLHVAALYLVLETARIAAGERGVGVGCFRWTITASKVIRHNLEWLIPAILPLRLLIALANWRAGEARDEVVARVLFVIAMGLCALFAHRVLHPERHVLAGTIAREPEGWLFRMRYVWYFAAVALPLSLAVGAILGYYYTVLQLGERMFTTLWLALVLIILNALLVQWLVSNRRRLSIAEARRKWQSERTDENIESLPPAEEPGVDVTKAAQQAGRFLRYVMAFVFIGGLWLIWVDVLPALGILRSVELWSRRVQVTEAVTNSDGVEILQAVDRVEPVTLAGLLFAVLAVMMTVVGAKNLPGIMEIIFLQRFRLDHGLRYAVSTVARYVIILVGSVVALRAIGVGWSNVQWMAAAVTVGLGFGLQEIFANFVSGLILLFERPIRVGDVVMVNGILGKVGRIQIRATTIFDMDHKELIIPNKEFITGQVINYTLSDTVIRLTVTVGVQYGADYDLAQSILLRLAAEHPIILDDPAPIAALSEFADSSVNFLLFVHLPDLNNFLVVRHDLIANIEREFRKAGITIPFPQRDLHVHTPGQGFIPAIERDPT